MIKINKVSFQVIGILPEKGATSFRDQGDVIVIPVSTAMHRLLGKDYVDYIDVEVADGKEMESAQQDMMQDEQKKRDEEFKNPLQPKIEDGRVVFGPKDAKVTIVEYSDFECPYCSRLFVNRAMQGSAAGDATTPPKVSEERNA